MKFFSYRFTSIFLFFSRAIGAAERKFSNNFSTIESSGVPICFKDQGEGPPVFFIHGYTSNALDWNIAINLLKDRFRLITIDCRGHGASGKPEDLTFYGRKMVADILEVLQKLEIEKVCLVGYSMGAEIALRFTVEHPEVVTGLVVGGSGWSGEKETKLYTEIGDSLKNHQSFGPFIENNSDDLELLDSGNFDVKTADAMLKGQNIEALAAVAGNMGEIINLSEQDISGIRIPVLAISGDQDDEKLNLEKMIGAVPEISYKLLPGKDHMEAFLDPEFYSLIEQFLISQYHSEAS